MADSSQLLRVMLVDDDPVRAALVETSLSAAGIEVISIIATTSALLYQIEQLRPDVVLIDLQAPGRDILESLAVVNEHNPTAMVMFAGEDDPDYIEQAFRAGVSTYQLEGINPEKVKPVIDVALAQFRSFQTLKHKLKTTESELADQKSISRAKQLLIRYRGMEEHSAHQLLTRMAMENNLKLGDVARTVISTLQLME